MIVGKMLCLKNVLAIEDECSLKYILLGEGASDYEISFGKNRKLNVPLECYIVTILGDEFELDKIIFDNDKKCNYLEVLKERKVKYEIPKSLPESSNRMYSRFRCAIGDTYWSNHMRGFFGTNGYAITDVHYIGDDRYENYMISLSLNPDSFRIGEHFIQRIRGYKIPKDEFIIKLLEENVQIEESVELLSMLKDDELEQDIKNIRFQFDDQLEIN